MELQIEVSVSPESIVKTFLFECHLKNSVSQAYRGPKKQAHTEIDLKTRTRHPFRNQV